MTQTMVSLKRLLLNRWAHAIIPVRYVCFSFSSEVVGCLLTLNLLQPERVTPEVPQDILDVIKNDAKQPDWTPQIPDAQ